MKQPSNTLVSNTSDKTFALVYSSNKAMTERLTQADGTERDVIGGFKAQLIYESKDSVKISAKGFGHSGSEAMAKAMRQLEREGYLNDDQA